MDFLRSAWIIAMKDLTLEARGKEILTTGVFFALITILIFSFALDMAHSDGRQYAAGVLWVAIFFSGALTMNRSFLHEKENDCLSALLLAPLDRSAIYFGKMGANLALMLVAEAFIVPVVIVIFNVNVLERFFPQALAMLLGSIGFSAVGTLVAAISVNLRAREMLGPLLALPPLMPVVMTVVPISSGLINGQQIETLYPNYQILAAFCAIYLAAPWILFEKLTEQ